jgi:hypothetical protein
MREISFKIIPSLALAGLLCACVTINIYFPAAAAEKVADKMIEDIWHLQETPAPNKPDAEKKEATQ